MHRPLIRHPDTPSLAATQVEVDVVRASGGRLALQYLVTGRIGDLRIPPPAPPEPANELWLHTCFELFVRTSRGAPYFEFNFAPSTKWAAFRFGSYRSGSSIAHEIDAPRIEVQSNAERFTLQVALDLNRVPGLPYDKSWQIGLSAVIEDASGRLSYWALAHPPGKADFHHADCFALELS
jgi:hypothetical protein